jgi:hypothetical protein
VVVPVLSAWATLAGRHFGWFAVGVMVGCGRRDYGLPGVTGDLTGPALPVPAVI